MKYLLLLFITVLTSSLFSQSDAAKLLKLLQDDSSSAQLLLNYPDSIRTAVLTAAQYPQAIARLGALQNSSSASFQSLLSKFSQERQKQLWDISRFPELPALIMENKGSRRSELKKVFSNYEPKTRKAAIYFARHNSDAVMQMLDIQKNFSMGYRDAIKSYPHNVKASYDVLLRYPELAATFARDTATIRSLGNLYSQNPSLVKHAIDSASQEAAKDYGKEYEDWKKGISSNPQVARDMKNLSREYKKDTDSYEEDDVYATGAQEKVSPADNTYNNYNYYVNPYPYWAGYPSWYVAPYWYPYPWWWSAGYYWYPHRPFYFYGMPTYHFGYWYYYHPRNYYFRYPHAGNYFYQHYQNYPRSNSGINHAVREWNGRRMGGGSFPAGGGRMGGGGYNRIGGGFPGGGGRIGGGGGGGRRR